MCATEQKPSTVGTLGGRALATRAITRRRSEQAHGAIDRCAPGAHPMMRNHGPDAQNASKSANNRAGWHCGKRRGNNGGEPLRARLVLVSQSEINLNAQPCAREASAVDSERRRTRPAGVDLGKPLLATGGVI